MNEPEKTTPVASPTVPVPTASPEVVAPLTPVAATTTPAHPPIPLKYPFKAGERTVHEVSFTRRPKAADLIMDVGPASAAEQELYTIAALLGVNAEDLKEMDGQDYLTIQREYAAFLGQ
jgi:hypothetical protein